MAVFARCRPLLALLVCVLALTACGTSSGSGSGGDAKSFYQGKTVTFVVPFSPGGGYDTYARAVAPYLGKQLGATVVVENQPGAGGLLAINKLVAQKPDGLTIAIMNGPGAGGASIAGSKNTQFKLDQLSYVGNFGGEGNLFVVGRGAPFTSFSQVQDAGTVRIGSTGPGASDYINANVISDVFGLKSDIVTGFAGSSENALAVTRGDVDAMSADFGSDQSNIQSGDHRPLLTIGEEPLPGLKDVPMVLDQKFPNDTDKKIMEANIQLVVQFERPIVGPPGMDPGRLAVLRDALATAAKDPAFQKDLTDAGRSTGYLDGNATTALVKDLLAAPPEYVAILKKAYQ